MTPKEKIYNEVYRLRCNLAALKGEAEPTRLKTWEVKEFSMHELESMRRASAQDITDFETQRAVKQYWLDNPDEEAALEALKEKYSKEYRDTNNAYRGMFDVVLNPLGFEVTSLNTNCMEAKIKAEDAGCFDRFEVYYREDYRTHQYKLEFSIGSTGGFEAESTRAKLYIALGTVLDKEVSSHVISKWYAGYVTDLYAVTDKISTVIDRLKDPINTEPINV